MQNNNDASGAFWMGLIIGVLAMMFWYHPKFQDKTAQEWADLNDQTTQQLNDANQKIKNTIYSYDELKRCLNNISGTYNYSYIYSEIIKKNDVDSCVTRYPITDY